jgi:hypothetical protein
VGVTARGAASASIRTMRARVIAPVLSGPDGYGHERRDGDDVRYDALPVRAWASTEQAETFGEATQGAVQVVRMIAARDAAVDTTCVVERIEDRRGGVVFAGPIRVIGVTRRADHIVIIGRVVAGGRA